MQVEGASGKVDGEIRDLLMSISNPCMGKRSWAFPLKVKSGAEDIWGLIQGNEWFHSGGDEDLVHLIKFIS